MATATTVQKVPGLVSPQAGTREEALALIFAPTKGGDGFRHGALGAPGYGKTYHVRQVIAAALERDVVDLVLSHDVKYRQAEFEGIELTHVGAAADPAQLELRRHLVYRGDVRADVVCEAEDVALAGKKIAQGSEIRVLLNIGELDDCLTEGGRGWRAPTVQWFSSKGRALGACLLWTTQQPKRSPDEIFDQSTTLAFFHHEERSANYLSNTLLLDEDLVRTLPQLAIGEFVLKVPAREWNRKVYRF